MVRMDCTPLNDSLTLELMGAGEKPGPMFGEGREGGPGNLEERKHKDTQIKLLHNVIFRSKLVKHTYSD